MKKKKKLKKKEILYIILLIFSTVLFKIWIITKLMDMFCIYQEKFLLTTLLVLEGCILGIGIILLIILIRIYIKEKDGERK